VKNPVGTAPAFIVETERNAVISLPGVPNEMEHILHESIIPYLQGRFNLREVIKVRVLHCAGLGEGMIDEKIADLETLSNPTVGLAAHTGVVDVRIAAKAESEAEAIRQIEEIEREVRTRLGNVVFGTDEDRLEEVMLDEVARRGWTLVAVESGLDGLLIRKIPNTVSMPDLDPVALMDAVRAARDYSNADIGFGVSVYADQRAAEMTLITPRGEKTHRITYGGPPRSLARWAMNLALNWVRTTAQEWS
jgi:RNA-binding protein YhbY